MTTQAWSALIFGMFALLPTGILALGVRTLWSEEGARDAVRWIIGRRRAVRDERYYPVTKAARKRRGWFLIMLAGFGYLALLTPLFVHLTKAR